MGVDVVGEAGVLLQRGLEGSDLLHEYPRASAGFGFVPEVPKAAHSAREVVVLGGCLAAALEVHDARKGVVLPPPEVDVALHWEEALWERRGVEFPDDAGVPRCGQGVRRDHLPCFQWEELAGDPEEAVAREAQDGCIFLEAISGGEGYHLLLDGELDGGLDH